MILSDHILNLVKKGIALSCGFHYTEFFFWYIKTELQLHPLLSISLTLDGLNLCFLPDSFEILFCYFSMVIFEEIQILGYSPYRNFNLRSKRCCFGFYVSDLIHKIFYCFVHFLTISQTFWAARRWRNQFHQR